MSAPHPARRGSVARYDWGDGCEGWRMLDRPDLAVIEERMPPGASERRHRHRRARQFFRVLSGELEIEIDGGTHRLGPGDGIEVPPGLPHTVRSCGGTDALFLVISAPTTAGDRESA